MFGGNFVCTCAHAQVQRHCCQPEHNSRLRALWPLALVYVFPVLRLVQQGVGQEGFRRSHCDCKGGLLGTALPPTKPTALENACSVPLRNGSWLHGYRVYGGALKPCRKSYVYIRLSGLRCERPALVSSFYILSQADFQRENLQLNYER